MRQGMASCRRNGRIVPGRRALVEQESIGQCRLGTLAGE